MAHVNIELHENYPGEKIPDWEHDFVHTKMTEIGFARAASCGGVDVHLNRASYFNPEGQKLDVERVYQSITTHLGRKVGLELTIGPSYLYGLKPLSTPSTVLGTSLLNRVSEPTSTKSRFRSPTLLGGIQPQASSLGSNSRFGKPKA